MTARRLADGRQFDPASPRLDVGHGLARVNAYDCAGDADKTALDRSGPSPRVVEAPTVHSLLSVDLDEGVTPMFVRCPDHGTAASSRMYRLSLAEAEALLPVRLVWRAATRGEQKRERRAGGEHYSRGGLALEVMP